MLVLTHTRKNNVLHPILKALVVSYSLSSRLKQIRIQCVVTVFDALAALVFLFDNWKRGVRSASISPIYPSSCAAMAKSGAGAGAQHQAVLVWLQWPRGLSRRWPVQARAASPVLGDAAAAGDPAQGPFKYRVVPLGTA